MLFRKSGSMACRSLAAFLVISLVCECFPLVNTAHAWEEGDSFEESTDSGSSTATPPAASGGTSGGSTGSSGRTSGSSGRTSGSSGRTSGSSSRTRRTEPAPAPSPSPSPTAAAPRITVSPSSGLPCTDDGNPDTTIYGCIYYIQDTTPVGREAELRAKAHNSVEVQYYMVPLSDDPYAALTAPYYIRVLRHRAGRADRVIGSMTAFEEQNTHLNVQMLYEGNLGGFFRGAAGRWLGVATVAASYLAIDALIYSSIRWAARYEAPLLSHLLHNVIRRNRVRTSVMGTATAFGLFLAVTGLSIPIINSLVDRINSSHIMDPAMIYLIWLRNHLDLGRNCLANATYCPQLVQTSEATGLLARSTRSDDVAVSTLDALEAREEAEAHGTTGDAAATTPTATPSPTPTPAVHVEITRPGIRDMDIDFVSRAFAAYFRPPCTSSDDSESYTSSEDRAPIIPCTAERFLHGDCFANIIDWTDGNCRDNMGPAAGFRYRLGTAPGSTDPRPRGSAPRPRL